MEQLLVPTPLEAFYLYRAEHYTIVERARTQRVFPRAGSHASDDIAYARLLLLELLFASQISSANDVLVLR